jgi:hypothetical protein
MKKARLPLFIKPLCMATALGVSLCSSIMVFAGEEEHMEVTAPNECCQTPMPGTIGLVMGMVGAPTAAGGGVREAALKMAVERAAKQKKKNKDKKEEEKTEYDKVTDGTATDTAFREIGSTFRQLFENGEREKFKYSKKNPDGSIEIMEYENCVPSGPLNPSGIKCTEQKFELFTDPLDGMPKWAFTMSVIEAKYNPKHYDANARGFYPAVVGDQTFTLVFETEADLMWQLNKVAGR